MNHMWSFMLTYFLFYFLLKNENVKMCTKCTIQQLITRWTSNQTCVSCLSYGSITPEPPAKPTLYYNIGLILRLCGARWLPTASFSMSKFKGKVSLPSSSHIVLSSIALIYVDPWRSHTAKGTLMLPDQFWVTHYTLEAGSRISPTSSMSSDNRKKMVL